MTENTSISGVLKTHFGSSMNLARIKLLALLIESLCKVQEVSFERLASGFGIQVKQSSHLRRIQRFFSSYRLDTDLIARMLFSLLPTKDSIGLALDRTNWKLGSANINILALGVIYQGIAFPILFTMLPKKGNSNSQERINLIHRFERLFPEVKIDYLVADREFVGQRWLRFLTEKKIPYHIRIKENFQVILPHKPKPVKVNRLFTYLKIKEISHYPHQVHINGVPCFLSGCIVKSQSGQPEYLYLISWDHPNEAGGRYKKRWQIETMFKALKTSGFNLENTHLTALDRLEKLIMVVFIAFYWCYKAGIYRNKEQPIKIKKHGYLAQSIFKYGLSWLASQLLANPKDWKINCYQFLSCT